jgi:hypothetical protein
MEDTKDAIVVAINVGLLVFILVMIMTQRS